MKTNNLHTFLLNLVFDNDNVLSGLYSSTLFLAETEVDRVSKLETYLSTDPTTNPIYSHCSSSLCQLSFILKEYP